ncbi:alpha/beta hydrolase [Sphingomonas sp. LM7]|uniref:alpha/beta hydrolase n=1 Tax=Sphingomonas sp. LM7 TaxID=1938607 RepID=UPI000983CEB3|nr:alpha/beta hydrolase [Sphingomonas sp. LM7]AQR74420.1 hypothetical protein BXU08_12845 [Sphingomonas sp. LM7]
MALRIVAIVGALYFTMLGALFAGQRALIFPAPRDATTAPPPGFSGVVLETEDGLRLAAAYRRGSATLPTLLFFHGNGDRLTGAAAAARGIAAAGYGVLLVEYRGYAGNPGSPGEQGLYRDGRAALAWLEQRGIAPRCVVVIGNSMGSGVATENAGGAPVAGLVLVSGFTSLPDVVAPLYPWLPVRMLLRDRFDNRAKIARVEAPMLLLHGTADRLIPARHSIALAGAARKARLALVPGAGHDLAYTARSQTMILNWLKQTGRACPVQGQAAGAATRAAASQSGTIASPSASTRRSSTIRPKSG